MIRKNIQQLQLTKTFVDSDSEKTELEMNTHDFFSGENESTSPNSGFAAGFPPFLRGTTTSMYVSEPWQMIQNPVFDSLEDWNVYLKKYTAANTQPLIFSLENNHKLIQTVDDFKIIFEGLSLESFSFLIEVDKNEIGFLAFLVVFAQEQGFLIENLSGILKMNPYNSFSNEKINAFASKIGLEILDFSKNRMPKFDSVQILGINDQFFKLSTAQELAVSLLAGQDFITNEILSGQKIDVVAPKISFAWTIQNNSFETIAKLRAARILWAKMIKKFNPQNPVSMALHQHCQTSKADFDTLDSFENLSQTCLEAATAVFGGVQSLQTDVSMVMPSQYATRMARDIQLFLKEETKITKTVDPWGGSFYIEKLTNLLVVEALKRIEEIESLGGLAQAFESSFFLKNQTIDFLSQSIIDEDLENNEIVKIERNEESLKIALSKLKNNTQSNQNRVDVAIEAAKQRATLKEIEACF